MAKKRAAAPAPVDSLQRYRALLGEADFSRLLDALAQPLPQALRANPLKVEPAAALVDWQARYGWQTQPVPFCSTGWQVLEAEVPPSATLEFRMGQYYIQDAASMLPAELFDFSHLDAPLILDMAAAPGGKTTHLVSRAGDHGLTLANDSAPGRIGALRGVLRDWGAVNAAVTAYAGERLGPWFPETFDCVLLDAPCSMDHLRPGSGGARRPASQREREGLAARQTRLLTSALQAVRAGGQVVYSTCTLAPEEDEGVLDNLLRRFPTALRVENLTAHFDRRAGALPADGERQFHPEVVNAMRLWPHTYGTSGFFAALLTKTAALDLPRQNAPSRPIEPLGWARLDRRAARDLEHYFGEAYAFNLPAVLERQRLALWQRGAGIHAFPEAFFTHFAGLPVEGLGLLLGEESPAGFQVSHEWVARFFAEFHAGTYILPEEHVAAWLRGEDAPHSREANGPDIVVVFDQSGRLMGRGKLGARGLRNLLPRRLL